MAELRIGCSRIDGQTMATAGQKKPAPPPPDLRAAILAKRTADPQAALVAGLAVKAVAK